MTSKMSSPLTVIMSLNHQQYSARLMSPLSVHALMLSCRGVGANASLALCVCYHINIKNEAVLSFVV